MLFRSYSTSNMKDWTYRQQSQNSQDYSITWITYGALELGQNTLINKSEVVPGIVNSLSVGDNFEVRVTNANGINQDYYDHYQYGIGSIAIEPGQSRWYMGSYQPETSQELAIYTYNAGNAPNYFDDSVQIETWNNYFRFDDYYGAFEADYLHIGNYDGYDYYNAFSYIDNWVFDGNDIYGVDGHNQTIYVMSDSEIGRAHV